MTHLSRQSISHTTAAWTVSQDQRSPIWRHMRPQTPLCLNTAADMTRTLVSIVTTFCSLSPSMTLWTRAKVYKSFNTKTCIEQGAGWLSVSPRFRGQMGTFDIIQTSQRYRRERGATRWTLKTRYWRLWADFSGTHHAKQTNKSNRAGEWVLWNGHSDRPLATDILVWSGGGVKVLTHCVLCVRNSVSNCFRKS